MAIQFVLLPLFVQVALTIALLLWMGSARLRALRRGEAKIATIALGQPNWPPRVQQLANCYANQFQIPLLYYVLTALAIVTRQADTLFVVLSWLFVATRLVHVYIHTGGNYVPWRFYAFVAGTAVLLVMWIVFVVRILVGSP